MSKEALNQSVVSGRTDADTPKHSRSYSTPFVSTDAPCNSEEHSRDVAETSRRSPSHRSPPTALAFSELLKASIRLLKDYHGTINVPRTSQLTESRSVRQARNVTVTGPDYDSVGYAAFPF